MRVDGDKGEGSAAGMMMSNMCLQRQALVVVTTYIFVRWRSVDGPGIGHEVQRKQLRISPSPCPNHVPVQVYPQHLPSPSDTPNSW